MQDPRIENELKTTPRVGRMFPLDNLHLPPVALVSADAAARGVHQTVQTAPKSPAKWHNRTVPQVIVYRIAPHRMV